MSHDETALASILSTNTMAPRPPRRIITVTEPGYDIALFFNDEGGAEAVISRPGERTPIGINIARPDFGRQIVIERRNGTFEVLYQDKKDT